MRVQMDEFFFFTHELIFWI